MTSKAPGDDDLTDLTAMLESGDFADATVTCGGQTWKVHRNIMSHRCAWFAKAFGGNFAEAVTANVKLDDHDAQQVDWMIKFIYAGQLPFMADLPTDKTTVHETCLKLFDIGDYFQLPSLTSAACETLKQHNRLMAAAYQRAVVAARQEEKDKRYVVPFFNSAYKARFFKQAKVTFSMHSASWTPIREAFFHFFDSTRYVVLGDSEFHNHLHAVPGLALLILRRLGTSELFFNTSFPGTCSECGNDILGDADCKGRFFFHNWPHDEIDYWGNSDGFGGTCNECCKEVEHEYSSDDGEAASTLGR